MTWNLVHTFFRGSSSTYIIFFVENFDIWGIFVKIKKPSQSFLTVGLSADPVKIS